MRTGTLLRDTVYLTHKHPGGYGSPDRHYYAPAGSRVEWDETKNPATNEGYEDCYGGRKLYWATIVGYGDVGLEEGVDVTWDEYYDDETGDTILILRKEEEGNDDGGL